MTELEPADSYAQRLLADVLATAEADSVSTPEAFTRRVLEELEQAGEVENTFVAHHAARGVEVSAYGTNESVDSVDLFLTHFRQVPERLIRKSSRGRASGPTGLAWLRRGAGAGEAVVRRRARG